MTTPRTGRPTGRPKGSLRDHPYRFALAFSDALREVLGITAQKSYLLAAAVFFHKSAAPLSSRDFSKKLHTAFEKFGGFPVSYELPASGNKASKSIKECVQPVNTLDGMAKRFTCGDDLDYREAMVLFFKLILLANFFNLILFANDPEMGAAIIQHLSSRIGDDAPTLVEWLQ
jgi:hypothetical protein